MSKLLFSLPSKLFVLFICFGFNSTSWAMANAGPSPLYVQVIEKWSAVTEFSENAAQVAVDKFEYDLKKDPKIAPLVTESLLLDLKQFFYELFNSQKMMIELARVYSEFYTISEMQDLIKFYQTPVGQKLIKTRAVITQKTQEIGDEMLKLKEKDYIEIIAKHIQKNTAE